MQLPEIQAAIALNSAGSDESVELLKPALPYHRAFLETVYLRVLAYLDLRRGTEAVAEFRQIAGHKGVSCASDWSHPYWGLVYSLFYLGMARGYALTGESAKAKRGV